MDSKLEEYLKWRWKRYNHKKYHKYFDMWFDNVSENQLRYFKKEMLRNIKYNNS